MSNTPKTDTLHEKLIRDSERPYWIAWKDYVEMRQHANNLEEEIERLQQRLKQLELKASASLANNLCQDHRDKQQGKPCAEVAQIVQFKLDRLE